MFAEGGKEAAHRCSPWWPEAGCALCTICSHRIECPAGRKLFDALLSLRPFLNFSCKVFFLFSSFINQEKYNSSIFTSIKFMGLTSFFIPLPFGYKLVEQRILFLTSLISSISIIDFGKKVG